MLKEKILGMSKLRKRIFAGAMATALISTSINLGSLAVEAGSSKNGRTVVAFEELPDEILYQYLPIGSEEFEIDFPDELNVTVYSDETDEDEEETEETEESEERKERDENEDDSDDSSESVDSDEDEEDRDTEEREDREEREDEEGSGSDRENSTDGGNNDGGSGSNKSGSDESGSDESDSHEDGDNPDSDPDDAGSQDEDSSDSSSGRSDNAGSSVDQGSNGSGTDTGSGEIPLPETEETEESPEASAFTFASPFSPVKVYAAEPDDEEEEDVRELGQGEEKTLKGVIWKLNKEESQYSRFQAVRSGDVFVYEPLIKAFGLKSEVPLPQIRVTITEEDGSYELREKEEASEEASEEATEEATEETEEAVSENEAEDESLSDNDAEESVSENEAEESVSENEAEESVSENEAAPFDQMMVVGGVRIRVEAPEGVFPAGASLKVVKLSDSDEERIAKYISDKEGKSEGQASDEDSSDEGSGSTGDVSTMSFDITILDKDGNVIQPNTEFGEAKVTFENASLVKDYVDSKANGDDEDGGEAGELAVYHFEDGLDNGEKLTSDLNEGERTVTVGADHFSPYTISLTSVNTTGDPSGDYGDYHLDMSGADFKVVVHNDDAGVSSADRYSVTITVTKLAASDSANIAVSMKNGVSTARHRMKIIGVSGYEKINLTFDNVKTEYTYNGTGSNCFLEMENCLGTTITMNKSSLFSKGNPFTINQPTELIIGEGESTISVLGGSDSDPVIRSSSDLSIDITGTDSRKCILNIIDANQEGHKGPTISTLGSGTVTIEAGTVNMDVSPKNANLTINGGFVNVEGDGVEVAQDQTEKVVINGGTNSLNYKFYGYDGGSYLNLDNLVISGGSNCISNDPESSRHGVIGVKQGVKQYYDVRKISGLPANTKVTGVYGKKVDDTSPVIPVEYGLNDCYVDDDGYFYFCHKKGEGSFYKISAVELADGKIYTNVNGIYTGFFGQAGVFYTTEYKPIKDIALDTENMTVGINNPHYLSHIATLYDEDGNTYSSEKGNIDVLSNKFEDITWTITDEDGSTVSTPSDGCYFNGSASTVSAKGDNTKLYVVNPGVYYVTATINDGFHCDIKKTFPVVNVLDVEDIIFSYKDNSFKHENVDSYTLYTMDTPVSLVYNQEGNTLPPDTCDFSVDPYNATYKDNISVRLVYEDGETVPYTYDAEISRNSDTVTFYNPLNYKFIAEVKDNNGNVVFSKTIPVVHNIHYDVTVKDFEYDSSYTKFNSSGFFRNIKVVDDTTELSERALENDDYKFCFKKVPENKISFPKDEDGKYIIPDEVKNGDISSFEIANPPSGEFHKLLPDTSNDYGWNEEPGIFVVFSKKDIGQPAPIVHGVFQIYKKDINDVADNVFTVTDPYNGEYDGQDHAAASNVTIAGSETKLNEEQANLKYSLTEDGPFVALSELKVKDKGEYSLWVSAEDCDYYRGKKKMPNCTIKVTARPITNTEITVAPSPIPQKYYTGEAVEPELTIKDTNANINSDLSEGTDYKLTYSNNQAVGKGIVTVEGIGNYRASFQKTFNIVKFPATIIPLYDGKSTIAEWYPGTVAITAKDYLVSESATGPFSEAYNLTGNTTNVSKKLYFKYVGDPSKDYYNAVVEKTVGPVNFTTTKPTGKIKVLDKSFSKLQTKAKTFGYTNEEKKLTITADKNSSKAGIKTVEYYMSNKFYGDENAVKKSPSANWAEYNEGSKPGLVENMLNYSYARIVDNAGNETYLSTQGVWYDTIEPKVKSAKTTPEDKKVTVEVKGEDKQSGIAYYYVLAKKTTEAKPTKEAVKSGGTKADNGNVEVTGLTPKTQYKLYSVIEDKCGNLSDIKETKVTTKEETKADATTAGAGGGKNGAGGAGGSGGAGGTTDGKKKGDDKLGDSNSKKRGVGASSNEASEAETDDSSVKSRIPYIDDATEGILTGKENTSGWDKITGEMTSADTPSEIHIDMNGSTVVPSGALNAFKGKDETLYFDMGNDIIWVVNGLSIEDSAQKDIDFKVKTDTRNIPNKLINEIADVYPHKNLTLSHDGEFGFTAILCVGVGAENSGMYANLYYYNENEKQLEFVESSDVDGNGNSEFEFTHASDYTVILRGDALTEKTADMITNNTSDGVEQVNDADTLVPEKKNHLWLLIITLISLALCGFILFVPDKRKAAG